MRLFSAVALLLATLAVSPAPSPTPKQDFASSAFTQIRQYEIEELLWIQSKAFFDEVYAPYCKLHGGIAGLTPVAQGSAIVRCKDKSAITVTAPK